MRGFTVPPPACKIGPHCTEKNLRFTSTHTTLGKATHWHPTVPVHSKNKASVRSVFGDQFMGRYGDGERTNVLVLGDSLGDALAAGEMCPRSTTCLSVGFYSNKSPWSQPVEMFEEVYDILFDGQNGDLAWLAEALKKHNHCHQQP